MTGATWSEIDLASKVWTVPAGRMKAGREHRVPLSTRAGEILKEAAKLRESDEPTAHLFPSSRRGQPLSNMAFKQLLVRMGETGFVPHGFRSSFRDWCGECTPFP
ncbi:tyrosine-type recombinase/integrase [Pinisolibacter aquiterrae]|uniref:tyrosine-type recombinase/integrase n=1 Tax=Pinisolibacter aquiterrae TaxID=2815579 RepID=UPI003B75C11C